MAIPNELMQTFQANYLHLIASLLRLGQIDLRTAKATAHELLNLLPFNSYDDLQQKIKKYTEKYPKLAQLYTNILKSIDHYRTKELMSKMELLINNNQHGRPTS